MGGAFVTPMVRGMYVDEKRLLTHGIAANESILWGNCRKSFIKIQYCMYNYTNCTVLR